MRKSHEAWFKILACCFIVVAVVCAAMALILANVNGKDGEDGADGKDGQDGLTITSVDKTTNGNVDTYTVNYSDGNYYRFTVTNATSGNDGVGIESLKKTASDENLDTYTIYLTDGSTKTFTVTNGVGVENMSTVNNTDAGGNVVSTTITINLTDGTKKEFTVTNGTDGEDGQDGQNGTQGTQGVQGIQGETGNGIKEITSETSGLVTTYTIVFTDTTVPDYVFTVTNGADGDNGKDGSNGVGIEDISVTLNEADNLIVYTFTMTDKSVNEIEVAYTPYITGVEVNDDGTITLTYSGNIAAAGETATYEKTINNVTGVSEIVRDGRYIYVISSDTDDNTETDNLTVGGYAYKIDLLCTHSWSETSTVDATCISAGAVYSECSTCGAVKTEIIQATGHDWDNGAVTTAATCTSVGVKTYTCNNCSETKTETIAELGHDWDGGTETLAATCTSTGVITYTCTHTGCTETKIEIICSKGHNLTSPVIDYEYDSYHTVYCADCGEFITEKHSYNNGTVCDICGYESKIQFGNFEPTAVTASSRSARSATVKTCSVIGYDGDADAETDGGDYVIIPSVYNGYTVTAIAKNAFKDSKIYYVEIPDSVTSIGENAFSGCTLLTSVIVPDSVTSIGESAFSGCTALTNLTIGEGVTTISNSAFSGCTALTTINYNATAVADLSDTDCAFLDAGTNGDGINLNVGANVTNIPAYLFYSSASDVTKITSVNFADDCACESIGEYAFYYCTALTDITIPESVTSLGNYAFYYCTALATINFNAENCVDLAANNYVFYNAGYSSKNITLNVGVNVTRIPAYIFYPVASSSNYPRIKTVTFADDCVCESIGTYAFGCCIGLTSVTIPVSVTFIGSNAFNMYYTNHSAYNVYYNGTASQWASITFNSPAACPLYYSSTSSKTGHLYLKGEKDEPAKNITIEDITTINSYAFDGCYSIESLTIGGDVTEIGSLAFHNCKNLSSVTINSQLKTINGYVFQSCTSLKEFTIPDSVETIGTYAFGGSGLTSITIPDSVTSIGNSSFHTCSSLASVTFEAESKLTTIGQNAFYNCSSLASFTIPETVTTIGSSAFYGCSKLSSNITIPDSVTTIDSNAFQNCTSLTSVTIGSGITSIAYQTFRGCTALKSVTFSDNSNLTTIGENAFYQCSALSSIEIPDSVNTIDKYAFYQCTALTSVTLGSGIETISNSAFNGCTKLASVTIPKSIKSIGAYAFKDCTKLTSVTFEDANGWYVTSTSGGTIETELTYDNLSNTSTAATYLKTSYVAKYWYKETSE